MSENRTQRGDSKPPPTLKKKNSTKTTEDKKQPISKPKVKNNSKTPKEKKEIEAQKNLNKKKQAAKEQKIAAAKRMKELQNLLQNAQKLVIRKLPPLLREEDFKTSLQDYFTDEKILDYYFVQGRYSKQPLKPPTHSRFYILFKDEETAISFVKNIELMTFKNFFVKKEGQEKDSNADSDQLQQAELSQERSEQEFKAVVERAIFKKMNYPSKAVKLPKLNGTIVNDDVYKLFVDYNNKAEAQKLKMSQTSSLLKKAEKSSVDLHPESFIELNRTLHIQVKESRMLREVKKEQEKKRLALLANKKLEKKKKDNKPSATNTTALERESATKTKKKRVRNRKPKTNENKDEPNTIKAKTDEPKAKTKSKHKSKPKPSSTPQSTAADATNKQRSAKANKPSQDASASSTVKTGAAGKPSKQSSAERPKSSPKVSPSTTPNSASKAAASSQNTKEDISALAKKDKVSGKKILLKRNKNTSA
ncbi:hypothetical protein CANARDRAFT_28492 [[Candida] arabinofermentans NRRL YB-2248]|uniref:UPF3 domain-containing protein n=1 Tax=[Candida] arabinofermentans NRRL YB-2248 TaxID=983967 RepID=A0A1E4T0G7_9ASCO|nr:hypothetical protein CANARDRAFT_28492 [[Candida] arabinofermentans NRRL YB-2248]